MKRNHTQASRNPQTAKPCALCLADAPLSRSHIIPEFNYAPLYDAYHRMNVLSTDKDKADRLQQKGLWEFLLCADCEKLFCGWEAYAARVMAGKVGTQLQQGNNYFVLGGIDYAKLKLYHLSVLWRMSVSSLPYFEYVNLGPYESVIRELLLRGDPGLESHFPCLLCGLTLQGEHRREWIMKPPQMRLGHRHTYPVVIAGVLHLFVITQDVREVPGISLTAKGNLMIAFSACEDIHFIKDMITRLSKCGRKVLRRHVEGGRGRHP